MQLSIVNIFLSAFVFLLFLLSSVLMFCWTLCWALCSIAKSGCSSLLANLFSGFVHSYIQMIRIRNYIHIVSTFTPGLSIPILGTYILYWLIDMQFLAWHAMCPIWIAIIQYHMRCRPYLCVTLHSCEKNFICPNRKCQSCAHIIIILLANVMSKAFDPTDKKKLHRSNEKLLFILVSFFLLFCLNLIFNSNFVLFIVRLPDVSCV